MVKPVILIREQDASFKLCGVEPMVYDGNFSCGIRGQRIDRGTIGIEDAPLCFPRGCDIVHIRELPASGVLIAHLPNTVGVDAFDRYALLDRVRHLYPDALALIRSHKRFNQSPHAPFC